MTFVSTQRLIRTLFNYRPIILQRLPETRNWKVVHSIITITARGKLVRFPRNSLKVKSLIHYLRIMERE
jgi:hypothetical protein